jgi:type II secretory pathway component PulJ
MDIFYVQGHLFFHTISRKVQFHTVAPVLDRKKDTLLGETRAVVALYQSRGFNIADLHTDMEFGCIRNDVLPTRLKVTAANDHVGEIERSIRTIKERTRTTIHGLPFERLPN